MICYRITNLITNKSYVGVTTVSIDRRFKQHCWAAISGEQNILYKAMRKYGVENFIVEELAHAIGTTENLYELERQVVSQEQTQIPNGYNMTSGGENPPSQAGKPSRRKGVKISEEDKQKLNLGGLALGRAWNKGKKMPPMPEEVRASISKTLKGRAKPEGFSEAIKQSWVRRKAAKKLADEAIQDIVNTSKLENCHGQ
jgi:group I intron endonuclease